MSAEGQHAVTTPATSARSLAQLKSICKAHGIKNPVDYKQQYKAIPDLPAHPERIFKHEWISYSDFSDIPEFMSYDSLKKEVQSRGINTQLEYRAWVKSLDNSQRPRASDEAYRHEWENWFDYCGQEKPLKPKHIPDQYQRWADKIQEFMNQAYGGESKENSLCRFVRIYIEKQKKSKSPEELLTSGRENVQRFHEELERLSSDNLTKKHDYRCQRIFELYDKHRFDR